MNMATMSSNVSLKHGLTETIGTMMLMWGVLATHVMLITLLGTHC